MATCAIFQTTLLKQQLAYLIPTWKNASIIGQFHAKGQTMKYFGINYFCNYKHHADAIWANDRFELEKQILTMHPNATAIYIWLL